MTTPADTVSELQKPNPSGLVELYEIHMDQNLHYFKWESNKAYTIGETVRSNNLVFDSAHPHAFPPIGLVFVCTAAGTSGANEPSFANSTNGDEITDAGTLRWTARQCVKRFSSGLNSNLPSSSNFPVSLMDAGIRFDGKVFEPFPIEAEGFAMSSKGTLPRPILTISNVNLAFAAQNIVPVTAGGTAPPVGTMSAIMLELNKVTVGNDFIGSTFVRIRTLAKFLPDQNFGTPNPTADPNQKFPEDIFLIVRKVVENQEIVQFECAMQNDNFGFKLPRRQILPSEFPAIGEFFQ